MNGKYLSFAVRLVRQAGKIFKKNFGKPLEILKKGGNPKNLVTEVDTKIEQFLKNQIHRQFPDHNILGEELGSADFNHGQGLKWFIDPIDGTTNYIQGIPLCVISLALWDSQGALIGVIYNPISENLYSAQRGKGAFLNGKKISVSQVQNLDAALGGIGWSLNIKKAKKLYNEIVTKARKIRVLGTTALQFSLVAEGSYDFYVVDAMHIWDVAAGILIVEEAGGKVTDWQGQKPNFKIKNLIASNGQIHSTLLREIKKI